MHELAALFTKHDLLLVFAATLAARLGLPVPAAPLLVIAGGLVAADELSLPIALGLAVIANVLGDGVWFAAGRRFGHRVLGLLCRVSLSPDSCVRQSESLIARWGGSSLIAAKFVPGVSVVAAPMAGALGMSVPRFVAYDALAGAVWAIVFLALGLVFSKQINELLAALANAGAAAVVLLLLALGAFVAVRIWRRRRVARRSEAPRISADALQALMQGGQAPIIIDVRSAAAAQLDPRRIPGAVFIDLPAIRQHAEGLPHDRDVVLYCNCPNEASAAQAAHLLATLGHRRARALAGGLDGWERGGRPVEHASALATARAQA